MSASSPPAVLSIAGSDSGGGAGIQADLKAFAALGVHGMTAITAITAQSTTEVSAIGAVEPELIRAQVETVAADIGVDAVKVGMLGSAEAARAVAAALRPLAGVPVVVDPVMVAESGAELLDGAAREELVRSVLPLATVVTPNLPEARRLAEAGPGAEATALAEAIRRLGPDAVIVTGGHADGTDLLDDGSGDPLAIPGEMHADGAAHGSGCTHSSSLAALLALGLPLREAAVEARALVGASIARGLREIGAGAGPVDALGLAARRASRSGIALT